MAIGDIGCDNRRLSAITPDLISDRGRGFGIDITQRQLCPAAGEARSRCDGNAACGTVIRTPLPAKVLSFVAARSLLALIVVFTACLSSEVAYS